MDLLEFTLFGLVGHFAHVDPIIGGDAGHLFLERRGLRESRLLLYRSTLFALLLLQCTVFVVFRCLVFGVIVDSAPLGELTVGQLLEGDL